MTEQQEVAHVGQVRRPTRRPVEKLLPDGPRAEALSLFELERIRDLIRGSVHRTQSEIDRVEALILAATLREKRRAEAEGIHGVSPPEGERA